MFHHTILKWYSENKRELPWRNTKDAYKIWISEIMLQQTKVDSVMGYYQRFLDHFPTVNHLADADEKSVLRLWQGLGYYSRARNLHHAAKTIQQEYNGVFPNNYKAILALKGIGTYTAAAISAFAYNLPYAVLDGNVFRVLSRYYGIDTPIDTNKGKQLFQQVATDTMETATPEIYNQAIIEFGALQCTPKQPKCDTCPVNINCVALKEDTIFQLPVKEKKLKIKNRYFYYIIIRDDNGIVLNQRTQKDIWQNMYEYPLIETNKVTDLNKITSSKAWTDLFNGTKTTITKQNDIMVHKLTHQNIHITFIEVEIEDSLKQPLQFISYDEVNNYPLPKPIETHLKSIEPVK